MIAWRDGLKAWRVGRLPFRKDSCDDSVEGRELGMGENGELDVAGR